MEAHHPTWGERNLHMDYLAQVEENWRYLAYEREDEGCEVCGEDPCRCQEIEDETWEIKIEQEVSNG